MKGARNVEDKGPSCTECYLNSDRHQAESRSPASGQAQSTLVGLHGGLNHEGRFKLSLTANGSHMLLRLHDTCKRNSAGKHAVYSPSYHTPYIWMCSILCLTSDRPSMIMGIACTGELNLEQPTCNTKLENCYRVILGNLGNLNTSE